MEKFERPDFFGKKDEKNEKGLTRRQFLKALGIGAAGAAAICSGAEKLIAKGFFDSYEWRSRYEKHGWHYTSQEMKKVYESEYQSPEKILKNTFRKENEKWVGAIDGEEIRLDISFDDPTYY